MKDMRAPGFCGTNTINGLFDMMAEMTREHAANLAADPTLAARLDSDPDLRRLNAETLLGNNPIGLPPSVRQAMRYTDCNGRTCTRTVDEAIAFVETLRSERETRQVERMRRLDQVRQEVRALREASGLCLYDHQCLLADGHEGECAFNVRSRIAAHHRDEPPEVVDVMLSDPDMDESAE